MLSDAVGVDDEIVAAIFNGSDNRRVPKMCRKCFLAYKKYNNSHKVLQDNLQKAITALELVSHSTSSPPLPHPPSKRPRVDVISSQGSFQSNKSPGVVVCIIDHFSYITSLYIAVALCMIFRLILDMKNPNAIHSLRDLSLW